MTNFTKFHVRSILRESVYDTLDRERDYQDAKSSGCAKPSPLELAMTMMKSLTESGIASGDYRALMDRVREATALGVKYGELFGMSDRESPPERGVRVRELLADIEEVQCCIDQTRRLAGVREDDEYLMNMRARRGHLEAALKLAQGR